MSVGKSIQSLEFVKFFKAGRLSWISIFSLSSGSTACKCKAPSLPGEKILCLNFDARIMESRPVTDVFDMFVQAYLEKYPNSIRFQE